MSLFGASTGQTGGLFGSSLGTNPQNQSSGGSLFGGLGQNRQNQPQQTGSLFGQSTQQNQPQQTGSLFGQTTQQQQQPTGGLFGQGAQQQTQQTGGLFGGLGQSTQQNQQQTASSLFPGISQSSQNKQPAQQSAPPGLFSSLNQNQSQPPGLFSQSMTQPQIPQLVLGQSTSGASPPVWQPNISITNRQKSVPDQITTVLQKWDTSSPNCAFQQYFYNKVDDNLVPFYKPGPNEDTKAWDEALAKKPGPGFIPVLCVGFEQLGQRIALQQQHLKHYNLRLHEINNSLSKMLSDHDTRTSIRAMDARRKHAVLRQRCLALATKVQLLRNRGYSMDGAEEDLKAKLQALEKGVTDPGLSASGEEIWARMLTVQERAKLLKAEIEKNGADNAVGLDEEMNEQAKKILEDYQTQLDHLKKEVEAIRKDYVEWEKEQGPVALREKQEEKKPKVEPERFDRSPFGRSRVGRASASRYS